jgi:hypothetical protein
MYVSDMVDELHILSIMEPYLIVLGCAIFTFFCIYLYLKVIEGNQNDSGAEEEDDIPEFKP